MYRFISRSNAYGMLRREAIAMQPRRLVWFDVPVRDLARATAFYEAVLHWNVKREAAGVAVFEHDDASTGGCLVEEEQSAPAERGALLYYNVNGRHEEAEHQVALHGGKVLIPKHPIGPFGYRSIVLDSEGNRIALHSEPEAA